MAHMYRLPFGTQVPVDLNTLDNFDFNVFDDFNNSHHFNDFDPSRSAPEVITIEDDDDDKDVIIIDDDDDESPGSSGVLTPGDDVQQELTAINGGSDDNNRAQPPQKRQKREWMHGTTTSLGLLKAQGFIPDQWAQVEAERKLDAAKREQWEVEQARLAAEKEAAKAAKAKGRRAAAKKNDTAAGPSTDAKVTKRASKTKSPSPAKERASSKKAKAKAEQALKQIEEERGEPKERVPLPTTPNLGDADADDDDGLFGCDDMDDAPHEIEEQGPSKGSEWEGVPRNDADSMGYDEYAALFDVDDEDASSVVDPIDNTAQAQVIEDERLVVGNGYESESESSEEE